VLSYCSTLGGRGIKRREIHKGKREKGKNEMRKRRESRE
jgi:hypothetical protein